MAEKGATDEAAPTFITAYLEEMEKVKKQGKDTTLCSKYGTIAMFYIVESFAFSLFEEVTKY